MTKVWTVIRDDEKYLLSKNGTPALFKTRDAAINAARKSKGQNRVQGVEVSNVGKATNVGVKKKAPAASKTVIIKAKRPPRDKTVRKKIGPKKERGPAGS